MTEIVKIGTAEMRLQDCMEYMCGLPDKAFDLAIVDPPYGIGMGGGLVGNSKQDYKKFAGGDNDAPPTEYFTEIMRVSKQQIIWGANHFIERMPINASGWIVWDKVQPEQFSMAMCELAWCSVKKPAKIYKQRIVGVDGGNRIHPTQKPVKLYEYLLANYAKPGQRILDTHLGSMSSVIACLNMGFEIVGCELDADYFKVGTERVRNSQKQQKLEI